MPSPLYKGLGTTHPRSTTDKLAKQPRLRSKRVGAADARCEAPSTTKAPALVLVGQHGSTALHKAAWNNSLEVVEVLVAANVNIDIKSTVRAGCSWLGAGH